MEALDPRAARLDRRALLHGELVQGREAGGAGACAGRGGERPARDLAQARRQARGDHLAQGAVVVARAEAQELEQGLVERRHVAHGALDGLQPRLGDDAALRPSDHHSHLARAPERHHDERAGGRFDRFRHEEIEALLERHVEGDAGNLQGRGDPFRRGRKSLWISL